MRKVFQIAVVVLCLVQGASFASADDQYDQCLSDSDGTNAAWSLCGLEYLDRLDATLNDTWQTVFPQMTEAGKTTLRAEQRAWNEFKELSCLHLANGDYGREGEVLGFPACRAGIIEERIDYLEGVVVSL